MATIELTAENFEGHVQDDSILFVDFWASWCGPCRQFAPTYEAASEAHPDITFGSVNTEEQQELSAAAGISSIPTLMAFRDGILVFNQPGALPAAQLEELIGAVEGLGRVEARGQDPVVGVDEDDVRLELLGLGGVHLAVADQDHDVAGVDQAGGGTVDADHAAAALAGDRVGLDPRAVGDVDDVDELAGQQVGGVEEVLVDGDRADVVQIGLGHGGPVDLALHHGPQHQLLPSLTSLAGLPVVPMTRGMLSIRRVVPSRAATRMRASVPGGTTAGSSSSSGVVIAR